MWSSGLGLTRCSLGENCAGAGGDDDDEGECTWWDEGLVLDVGFPPVGLINSKMMGSSLNVMLFLVFGSGSLKGVNIVTSGWNLSFSLWGVLKWWSVMTQWLQVSSVSPVVFFCLGLRLCMSVLFPKFLSLSLSTTLVFHHTASAERIELFLSLSGSSHPWLGELSRRACFYPTWKHIGTLCGYHCKVLSWNLHWVRNHDPVIHDSLWCYCDDITLVFCEPFVVICPTQFKTVMT